MPEKFYVKLPEPKQFHAKLVVARKLTAQLEHGLPIPGPPGEPGPPGQDGADSTVPGPPGTAATIEVGTTTTGAAGAPAEVVNTGTSSAAVFSFTIPQGIKGDTGADSTVPGPKGDQGEQGDPGPPGADSTVPGPAGEQGPPGFSSSFFDFMFSGNTAVPPGDGQLRFDNADQTLATVLRFDHQTSPGNDISIVTASMTDGDEFLVQDQDNASRFQQYLVTGPAQVQSGYTEVPVSWTSGGTPLTEQRVFLVWRSPGPPGPPGPAGIPIMVNDVVIGNASSGPSASTGGGVGLMTAASFNAETSNGAANPNGYGIVVLSDEDTLCMWDGTVWKFDISSPYVRRSTGSIFITDYTWTNQGTATATQRSLVAGGLIMSIPPIGGTNWRILKRDAPPSAPWTATLLLTSTYGSNSRTGLVIIDNAGKMVSLTLSGDGSRSIDNWNSPTSFASGGNPFAWVAGDAVSVRVEHTGTNLKYYKKTPTDAAFVLLLDTAATAWLGATIASIGFGSDGEGSAITGSFLSLAIA